MKVYILEKYEFYESSKIIMLSADYEKLKRMFDEMVGNSPTGRGYVIYEYEYDKNYEPYNVYPESLDWIEKDYNGNLKNIKKELK